MRPRHIVLASALACLAVIVAASHTASAAGSRACRQIEAELAAADRGGSSARLRQFDRAIDRQREQMAITREQARDAGCGFALSGRAVRQCASLNATLDRMLDNLDKLERDRSRLAQRGSGRSRRTLLAALEANGCREEASIAEPLPTPLGEMLDREASDRPLDEAFAPVDPDAEAQRFRTMCVRTCDGYFYPMSNAATVGDFDRDQKNCETSCPGTEMQIYYDAAGLHDPASMVSTRSGMSYAALPMAFVHRDISVPRDPQCGCGVAKNFEVIAGTPRPAEPEAPVVPEDPQVGGLPVPTPRPDGEAETAALPDPVDDPPAQETPAPAGSIITVEPPQRPQPIAKPTEPVAPAAVQPPAQSAEQPDPARSVRVVGPEFLPDPEGALDLKGPARTTDR